MTTDLKNSTAMPWAFLRHPAPVTIHLGTNDIILNDDGTYTQTTSQQTIEVK